jgi:hypothetical protein
VWNARKKRLEVIHKDTLCPTPQGKLGAQMELPMTRKEEFLRAVQLVDPRRPHDLPLAFGWALNLREKTIPRDIKIAARKFAIRVSG